jgi:hypothetical protein
MLSRTYHESQNKPTYAIREIREASAAVLSERQERPRFDVVEK